VRTNLSFIRLVLLGGIGFAIVASRAHGAKRHAATPLGGAVTSPQSTSPRDCTQFSTMQSRDAVEETVLVCLEDAPRRDQTQIVDADRDVVSAKVPGLWANSPKAGLCELHLGQEIIAWRLRALLARSALGFGFLLASLASSALDQFLS
jgi:hypothetical protein